MQNTLVHTVKKMAAGPSTGAGGDAMAAADALYTGPKAALRPIHDRVMAAIREFGSADARRAYSMVRR